MDEKKKKSVGGGGRRGDQAWRERTFNEFLVGPGEGVADLRSEGVGGAMGSWEVYLQREPGCAKSTGKRKPTPDTCYLKGQGVEKYRRLKSFGSRSKKNVCDKRLSWREASQTQES